PDMSEKFWDFLAGEPLFGQRVMDIHAIIEWIKIENGSDCNIKIWGTGMCSLYAAFSGVLEENITGLVLENPLISFESVVTVDIPGYNHEILLPGILEHFDMQQIYQSLVPKPVMLINPLSGDRQRAGMTEMSKIAEPVSETYRLMNCPGNWGIRSTEDNERRRIISESLVL
ncbi:MAG: hypothetical protein PHN68_12360, partial [Prolixibacteraceae bacterium]|nr:hypothetical protein [Prolixibacteraceae bacterium]